MKKLTGKLFEALGLTGSDPVQSPKTYRRPSNLERALGPVAFELIKREAGVASVPPENALYELWRGIPGAHKWLHYFEIYEPLFSPLAKRPIRMLEIGVYNGGSLSMWRSYLHPQSIIVGIDIEQACSRFDDPDRGVFVRIGDQSNEDFLRNVVAEFGPFDVILDDGSHVCSHMIASFRHLFLSGLCDNGIYVIEDTHTNFWTSYRDQAYSFVDLAKDLVDLMHSHYAGNEFERKFRLNGPDQVAAIDVPRISAHLKEVSFHDSIILIRKSPLQRLPVSQHL